jgi:hypothetical protein
MEWEISLEKLSDIITEIRAEYKRRSGSAEWFWFKPVLHRVEYWSDGKSSEMSFGDAIEECSNLVQELQKMKPGKDTLKILSDFVKTIPSIKKKWDSLLRTDDKFRRVESEQKRLKELGNAEALHQVNQLFQKMLNQAGMGLEPSGLVERRGEEFSLRSQSTVTPVSIQTTATSSISPEADISMAKAVAAQVKQLQVSNEWVEGLNSEIQKLAEKLESVESEPSKKERQGLLERADFWLDGYDDMDVIGQLIDKVMIDMQPVSTKGIPPEFVVFAVEYFSRIYPDVGLRYDATFEMLHVGE